MNSPAPTPAGNDESFDLYIQKDVVPLMKKLTLELRDIVSATETDKDFKRPDFDGINPEARKLMEAQLEVTETPSITTSREFNAKLHRAASALLEVGEKAGMVELALLVTSIRESQTKRFAIRPEIADILRNHYPAEVPLIDRVKKPKPAPQQQTEPEGSAPATSTPQSTKPLVSGQPSQYAATVTRRGALTLIASGIGYALYNGHEERKEARKELKQMVRDEIKLEAKGPSITVEEREQLLTLQRITRPEVEEKTSMGVGTYALGALEAGVLLALLGDFTFDLSEKNSKPKKKSKAGRSADAVYPAGSPVAEVVSQLDDTLQEASVNGKFNIPDRPQSALGK